MVTCIVSPLRIVFVNTPPAPVTALYIRDRASHPLVLNGATGDGEGDDEADAAPSRWADDDVADDRNDVQSLDDLKYSSMLVDMPVRDVVRRPSK